MSVKKKEKAIYCWNCLKTTRQTRIGKSKTEIQSQITLSIISFGVYALAEAVNGNLGGPTYYECTICGYINSD